MGRLITSELQFAFTFFAKFNALQGYRFTNLVVPSTRQEGDEQFQYNGTDLVLDQYYIQFKCEDHLVRSDANEYEHFERSYFRFTVYNTIVGNGTKGQLDFLKDHCNGVNQVYYIAPCFDTDYSHKEKAPNYWATSFYRSDPNDLYDFVTFIDIDSIHRNWIQNNNNHKICYTPSITDAYYYSEPKKIKRIKKEFTQFNFESITKTSRYSNLEDEINNLIPIRL